MSRPFALFIYDEELIQADDLHAMCPMVSCEALLESIKRQDAIEKVALPYIKEVEI